jgi:hypothetical protein
MLTLKASTQLTDRSGFEIGKNFAFGFGIPQGSNIDHNWSARLASQINLRPKVSAQLNHKRAIGNPSFRIYCRLLLRISFMPQSNIFV